MLFWAEFLAAQNRDCYEETKLSKIAIRLASLGHVGSGNVWNFYHSLQHEKNISQTLLFRKDSINVQHIVSLERRTSKSYTVSDNNVYEDAFENGLQKYSYEIKPTCMTLPLSEDISKGIFIGYGTYSGKISSCIFGEYKVCCDAYGIVVTPENDSIRKLYRVKSPISTTPLN